MDPITKAKGPKPVRLIKALIQCTVLFCVPGLIITFAAPSFTIELTRFGPGRVDATVTKHLIFIAPFSKNTATNITDPESRTIDGGLIRQGRTSTSIGKVTGEVEDQGLLLLKGSAGEPIEIYISPKNLHAVEDEIQYFINESKEPSLQMWVVSNWKFGVILPGGILLFCLVVFFLSAWSIITGRSLERKGSRVGIGLKSKKTTYTQELCGGIKNEMKIRSEEAIRSTSSISKQRAARNVSGRTAPGYHAGAGR
jgi:hypothetical protein